jgi:glutathione synthase/RimK-type ligase-like ATP-grasp enzyme
VTPPPAQAGRFIGIRPFAPEPELADRCCRLTAKPGLVVAGISLRRTPAGRWFCCEVNRSPGFAVCQHAAGGRVAEAIADLLAVKRRIG